MSSMRPAQDRLITGGIRLVSAFEHSGAAKELMHHLKYRGIGDFPDLVAAMVVPRLPTLDVVPVPRAISRRLKYGVDPARVIARAIAVRLGSSVLDLLAARAHSRRRAGRDHRAMPPKFGIRSRVFEPIILVDDVYTTGATVRSAIASLGLANVFCVVTANVVPELSSLSSSD